MSKENRSPGRPRYGNGIVLIEGQINALARAQKKAAKFAHHGNESNWETLTERRKIACLCALFKAYMGERAWKAIGDRLQTTMLSEQEVIMARKLGAERSDRYQEILFVNRTVQLWNQLSEVDLGALSCKPSNFRKRIRKVINKAK
jgi:hypothetical protein